MWKSIIYKEWIKTRWFLIVFAALGLLAVGYIFLKVQHDYKFNDPNNYWYFIIFQGFQYFGKLKFIPIIGGLAIAIAQYFPETVDKRIKLTFHLPINENIVLIMMMLFGTVSLLVVYITILLLFYALSTIWFPANIIAPALITITPWFLSGFAIYYLASLILLEPVWKFRLFYLIFASAIFPVFLESNSTEVYAPINLLLFILVIFLTVSLLFSGYRFRKGEM